MSVKIAGKEVQVDKILKGLYSFILKSNPEMMMTIKQQARWQGGTTGENTQDRMNAHRDSVREVVE